MDWIEFLKYDCNPFTNYSQNPKNGQITAAKWNKN